MSIFSNFFHVKEAPILSVMGFGGGGTGTTLGGSKSSVTGGTLVPAGVTSGSYTYYGFTSSGALTIVGESKTFDILVVAGGGQGGHAPGGNASGGAGGGGVAYLPNITLAAGTYPVTVGDGGGGASFPSAADKGDDSSFATSPNPYYILAKGGGAGAVQNAPNQPATQDGGSGGGGVSTGDKSQPSQNSHNGNILNYGNDGGSGSGAGPGGWGGGGGAGAAGGFGPGGQGGAGGNGQPFPAFPAPVIQPLIPSPARPTWTPAVGPTGLFAGGGGGGSWNVSSPQPQGGTGGGGNGDTGSGGSIPNSGNPGVEFTGGGGGGGGPSGRPQGMDGGAGIVLLRMTN